ncbi:MAG: enoyl-CoA hydratase-related protein [Deltaproteobacteria bacterium]|jgi:naphthoate synthase/2-ketocyclohexanecarboxyl-CoA hydrolase|nr:enoyl-CoA hydratase-related protein [Deltaproteobacteria bacterium]
MAWEPWTRVAELDLRDIIYEKRRLQAGGGAARITINRPERLNAFTAHSVNEMATALDDASHDPEIGVVVLTGAGDRAFSSGGDVEWEAGGGLRRQFYHALPPNHFLRMCRKPIIAAVKGYAIGGGNHLAYCCDFTIAAENAIFGQNGPRVASPADGYPVAYLTRVVGAKRAREMWMLCRRYDARQALAMGLVNAVVPLDKLEEEVDKWCEEILALNPTCIEVLKATFDSDIDYLAGSFGRISSLMAPDFFEGPDPKEAAEAFFGKRKPDFWQFRKRRTRS